MIKQNKISKYLLYAIGEIILVVIGILIALQINNWNEKRQNNEKALSIFNNIQADLLNDIKKINRYFNVYANSKDSLVNKVIHGELVKTDYSNNIALAHLGTEYYPVTISNQSFLEFSENKSSIPSAYKPIVKDLNIYYSDHKDIFNRILNELLKFNDNLLDSLHSQLWYRKIINDSIINEDALDYYLNDVYKSKILLFKRRLDRVKQSMNRVKQRAIQNYLILNQITNVNDELPKIIANHINGSLKMSESYAGEYVDYNEYHASLIEQNGLLFSYLEDEVYSDKFIFSELKKDSIQAINLKHITVKFIRDENGHIIGSYEYSHGEKINEYKKISND